MATEPTPQRAYRSACPNCGAPVDFRSAASAFAVCSFCRSTLLRDGDALRRIGQSAELFDDHSPLALGASGRYQGAPFALVGRVQWRYEGGVWSEWHALFDAGGAPPKPAWLSEDNGQYVLAFDAPLDPADQALPLEEFQAGETRRVAGQHWAVASVQQARIGAAEGELPFAPALARDHRIVDLRSIRGEVATLERVSEAGAALRFSIGRSVTLPELAMTGLAEAREKTLGSRGLACPNCGAPIEPTLSTTQSIVCGQCRAVVDISSGAGADLAHYTQGTASDLTGKAGGEPQIPLGSSGELALGTPPLPWQVVGYVERATVPRGRRDGNSDGDDEEQFFWREYLLYNRLHGFASLVDAEDGWSWTRPITGVPEGAGGGSRLDVLWQGVRYRPTDRYVGRVTYVLGEFYWRLQRDERTFNTDYQGVGGDARKRLNQERTGADGGIGAEVVWSAGEAIDAAVVAAAFRLAPLQQAALRRDASPLGTFAGRGSGGAWTLGKPLLIFIVIAIVILAMSRCGRDDCDDVRQSFGESSNEYRQCLRSGGSGAWRTGGGSFGGFSSGGSHK